MNVDDITIALLEDTLRAWRQAEEPPAGLLALDVLSPPTQSKAERAILLRDLVEEVVSDALSAARMVEGLPDVPSSTRVELLANLSADFATANSELQAWSALYHRFLAPVSLPVEQLAAAIPINVRNFRHRVGAGLRHLAAALRRRELAEHTRLTAARRARHLPPAEYTRLFGIDAHRRQLGQRLRVADGPVFLSIEGLGGIGKTALARSVAAQLAEDSAFEGIAWVSARQTILSDRGTIESTEDAPTSVADIVSRLAGQLGFADLAGLSAADKLLRLSAFLGRHAHLIVIDNLESVKDVEYLLPALAPLGGSTRFVLTTRESMSRYPFVTCFSVPPLSFSDSYALVSSELRRHGRSSMLRRGDMESLYHVVGGTPLALKLIAAQSALSPLPLLIDKLRAARHPAPENLYTFIYRTAWLALDDDARRLLLSLLTIAPDGEDISWLRLVGALPDDVFNRALRQLLAYSLLDLAGEPAAPRYRLHRLTATFLQTEILAGWDWPTRPPPGAA